MNGEIRPAVDASISVLDHGLLYGDGLFETLRVVRGRCFQLAEHLARLADAAERLVLPLPWGEKNLAAALHATAAANGMTEGGLRLTVTRGPGAPLPDPQVCGAPTYFITARPARPPDPAAFERGLRLALGPEHPRLFVPGIKSLCYLPFQVARTAARAAGYDDALLQHRGVAVETSVSNLFVVRNGEVLTPPLETGCLPGVTRALLLRLGRERGLTAREEVLPVEDVLTAAEVFVTNSLQGVLPVLEIQGRRIGDGTSGPVTRSLEAAYRAELESEDAARAS